MDSNKRRAKSAPTYLTAKPPCDDDQKKISYCLHTSAAGTIDIHLIENQIGDANQQHDQPETVCTQVTEKRQGCPASG